MFAYSQPETVTWPNCQSSRSGRASASATVSRMCNRSRRRTVQFTRRGRCNGGVSRETRMRPRFVVQRLVRRSLGWLSFLQDLLQLGDLVAIVLAILLRLVAQAHPDIAAQYDDYLRNPDFFVACG